MCVWAHLNVNIQLMTLECAASVNTPIYTECDLTVVIIFTFGSFYGYCVNERITILSSSAVL